MIHMKAYWCIALLCCFASFAKAQDRPATQSAVKPEPVKFRSGEVIRNGCLYRPAGKGPFPIVIFSQSANKPSYEKLDWPPFASLAQFFTSHGYAFFLPGRYSQGGDPKLVVPQDVKGMLPMWELEGEGHVRDVIGAIDWAKTQTYIDEDRVVLCGHSAGAISVLLASEKKPAITAIITFSVGAISWNANARLQIRLRDAVKETDKPIFLLQPENDYSTEPSRVLGDILRKKGSPNRVKVFPHFGDSKAEANLFGINGDAIWGNEVLDFLDKVTKTAAK
jgi:dienelactone hydrolase